MEKHAVSKLIGSPPGYVGHEEGGQLTERVRRNPYSVVLLDEIEKAHPDIANILLQILEDGILTDSLGNQVDFRNTLIIMTSNLGTRFLRRRATWASARERARRVQRAEEDDPQELKEEFSPEFINRIDDIIIFNPLGEQRAARRSSTSCSTTSTRPSRERGLHVEVSDRAQGVAAGTRPDVEPSTGARPLRRAIQRHIQDAVSEILINQHGGEAIERIDVDLEGGELTFHARAQEIVVPQR